MESEIRLVCAKCGSKAFHYPDRKLSAKDEVTCAGCGARARYGELVAQARAQAVDLVAKTLRGSFKRFGKSK